MVAEDTMKKSLEAINKKFLKEINFNVSVVPFLTANLLFIILINQVKETLRITPWKISKPYVERVTLGYITVLNLSGNPFALNESC